MCWRLKAKDSTRDSHYMEEILCLLRVIGIQRTMLFEVKEGEKEEIQRSVEVLLTKRQEEVRDSLTRESD